MTNNNNRAQLKKAEQELKNMKRKYLNMLNNNGKNNNNKTKNSPKNKNPTTWLNREMSPGNKTNIKPSKRAYLKTNVAKNGKILHVYDRDGLKNYLAFSDKMGLNAERPSPLTRKVFKLKNTPNLVKKFSLKVRRGKKTTKP